MLSEIAKVFNDQFKDLDKVIVDGYIPAEGTYIVVTQNSEGNLEEKIRVDLTIDKKTKTVDRSKEMFNEICFMDYNSRLIDMNKPIDPKKVIHSNNYLSFIIKKESLQNGKLTKEIIKNYYEILENPMLKYGKKARTKELYEKVANELGEVNKEKLLKVKEWINNNVFSLNIDTSKKNYLKIFFLFDKEEFSKEGKRYVIPNIYNSNDFNISTKDGIVGLPNDNMGLNSKKPYLENKTRKATVPYLLNQEEVLLQKKLFDYLYNLASQGLYNLYFGDEGVKALKDGECLNNSFNGYYLRIKKGKETEIHDFDVVSNYSQNLIKKFEFKNILGANYDTLYGKDKKVTFQYGVVTKLRDIELLINEILYSKFLVTNYFSEDISVKDNKLVKAIFLSRERLHGWFYKGNETGVWQVLDKASDMLLKRNINEGYFVKAMNAFNLRHSLKEYFKEGEGSMADLISTIKDELRGKVFVEGDFTIKTDDEFSYAVGQITNYLLGKSNGKNKPMSLINPIINCKNEERIKEKLRQLFKKYNYDISSLTDVRFKRLYSLVLGYKIENKINEDFIIAGYLNSNLIYEKKEN